MAQNAWSLPNNTDDFIDARSAYNDAINNLATNHSGAGAPGTVHDYMWRVDTTDSLVKMEDGGGGWLEMLKLEANGGMLRIDGTNAMAADLDLNGNDVVLDASGDSKFKTGTEDELGLELGGTEFLRIGDVIGGEPLMDLKAQLRFAQPKGIAAAAAGAHYGTFPVDIDGAGTVKYVELLNAP